MPQAPFEASMLVITEQACHGPEKEGMNFAIHPFLIVIDCYGVLQRDAQGHNFIRFDSQHDLITLDCRRWGIDQGLFQDVNPHG